MLDFINIAHAVTLPTFDQPDLPAFIKSVYSFALTAVGIAVFIRILWAGFLWLTAAGNASKAGDAKNKIQSAVIGAILLFAAYLILYIINPDLVKNTFNFNIPQSVVVPSSAMPQAGPTAGGFNIIGCPSCVPGVATKSMPVANAQEGVFFFSVKVVDINGDSCEQKYNMEILPNIKSADVTKKASIVFNDKSGNSNLIAHAADDCSTVNVATPFLPNGTSGLPYFAEISVVGGTAPYSASVVDGYLPDGLGLQTMLDTPILTIENKTATRNPSYFFYENDKFSLTLTNGQPNKKVFIKWQRDGQPWFYPGKSPDSSGWTDFGVADAQGKWINEEPFSNQQIGQWYEWAMVDGNISNPVGFQVLAKNISVSVTGNTGQGTSTGQGTVSIVCVPDNYCEDKTTGQRSEYVTPQQQTATGIFNVCPGNKRIVNACIYPSQNPQDRCQKYQFEWRNCNEAFNRITGAGGITLDTSKVPYSTSGYPQDANTPPGTLWKVDQWSTTPLGHSKTAGAFVVYCRYSDQDDATRCGMPRSGEYCDQTLLSPTGGPTGYNTLYCANPVAP